MQVHPVHGSLSVFAVEVIPHNPGGVDSEAQCHVVRRLPDGRVMVGTPYTNELAAEMVAAAEDAAMARRQSGQLAADAAELDTNFEEAARLTDSALADAHEEDDDEV